MKIKSNAFINSNPKLVLKTVFGYDNFRPLQTEIINNVLSGNDTLAVMPTGGGKSLCYQLPALILEGVTVVVSPLISLMQDQVNSLKTTGINSVFLNSSLNWDEYLAAMKEIKSGEVKIVYVSPEGLNTGRIKELLSSPEIKVSCITIDEAHCVSEWGHDFRPDYMEIASVRKHFPDAVMLALTATATEQVRKDIVKNLGMKKAKIFISSFNRENIFLEVQPKRSGLDQVIKCIKQHIGESGIIYCYSRKQVDELTATLDKLGYSVLNYHAGLSDKVRAKNQELFIKDEVQIIVATIAFGMGINKPNVRFVINYDLPKSIEEYYQEIGRAGRDGLPSSALLLYSANDIHKIRYFFDDAADPEKSEILLQNMVRFATARTCRRRALLGYFGEDFSGSEDQKEKNCCCDICKNGELPLTDVTIPAQKLLSCIIRTNQRFGATYVVDVLLGSKNQRIISNEHHKLSTWGIGTEYDRYGWLDLIDLLVSENYLFKTGEYNVLELTERGKRFIAARAELKLPMATATSVYKKAKKDLRAERIVAEKPAVGDAVAEKVAEDLKAWRKRKADDLNIAPYMIFGDKTLLDLAAKKPQNKMELLNVYGIGKAKAEEFGRAILQIIQDITSSS